MDADDFIRNLVADGQAVALAGNMLLDLRGSDCVWYVSAGRADIFVVAPDGARDPFVSVGQGKLIFPLGGNTASDTGFLFRASGVPGTRLIRIETRTLKERVREAAAASLLVTLIDHWLQDLALGVARHVKPQPRIHRQVSLDDGAIDLKAGERLRATSVPLWISGDLDRVLFIGMETPVGSDKVVPLTSQSWVEAISTSHLETLSTATLLLEGRIWTALQALHEVVLACEQLNVRLASVDEYNRLLLRQNREALKQHDTLASLVAAVDGKAHKPAHGIPADGDGHLWQVAQLVAQAAGIELRQPMRPISSEPESLSLSALLAPSWVRSRKVELPSGWHSRQLGPLVGWTVAEGRPVALLPGDGAGYVAHLPDTEEPQPVDAILARSLRDDAVMLYRGFGSQLMHGAALLRFGLRGGGQDVTTILSGLVVTGLLGWCLPYGMALLLDRVIPTGDSALLWTILAALLASAVAAAASQIAQGTAILRLESRFDVTTGAAVIDRMLRLPPTFFRRYPSGDLGLRVLGLSSIRHQLSALLVNTVLPSLSGLLGLGMLWMLSPPLALVATFLVGFSLFAVAMLARQHLRRQRNVQELQGRLASLLLEIIANIAKIRVAAVEGMAFARWADLFGEQRRNAVISRELSSRVSVWLALLPSAAMIIVLSGTGSTFSQSLGTGGLIAFQVALMQVVAALVVLCPTLLAIVGTVPQYERMSVLLRTVPEVPPHSHPPGQLTGALTLSHLSFRYDATGPLVLDDVSLSIAAGEFVAFVGSSGSGKSTILRLLLGFEAPERGTISLDGKDLKRLDITAVRRQMGVVLQHSRLIPGTIFDNIVGSSPLKMDDAWEAARLARLDDDIRQMPMGMHSLVGDGAGALSGGQRQRLLIARALASRPRLLLLDEATSALDNRTQADVMQSLEDLTATRIVVAHRLSTVMKADRICVIKDGRIVQQGRYGELISEAGPFLDLVRRQQL